MEHTVVDEQNIINAICIDVANKYRVMPEDVEAELMYEDDKGFSAEAWANGRHFPYSEAGLVGAIRQWLADEFGEDPYALSVRLELNDEGIAAIVS